MNCEVCDKPFNVVRKGSGGNNRILCYNCLPEGFDKNKRTSIRQKLLSVKAKGYKLNLGCSNCGYVKCSSALEWHHPEDDKLINPSNAIKCSWARYEKEIEKCVLLCANCHREKHHHE